MTVAIFQDTGQNSFLAYTNTTQIGVIKSAGETLMPIWSFLLR
jgi:hypothetical protein